MFGTDYQRLTRVAGQVEDVMKKIPGVEDVQVARVSGQHEFRIRVNRERLARYGLDTETVLDELEMAVGGRSVARVFRGEQVHDVFVRYAPEARSRMADLERILVHSPDGGMIPLSAVADLDESSGFGRISRENGRRYVTIQCNVRGRSIGDVVRDARRRVYTEVTLPVGVYLGWGGQFELKERAENRLMIALAVAGLVILILLFDFLGKGRDILIILINLPVSLSGGMIALWLSGAWISVPSTIGFLVLLGIALENTLILSSFLRRRTAEAGNFHDAVRESVSLRLRPILMTKFTTMIGLVPLLFSTGIGSEIQRPLVIVVMGGIFFSIFTTLLLLPVTWRLMHGRNAV